MTQRQAIVTGGASGIGAAVVMRLTAAGYEVTIVDVHEGPGVIRVDVADASQCAAAVSTVTRRSGEGSFRAPGARSWVPLEVAHPTQRSHLRHCMPALQAGATGRRLPHGSLSVQISVLGVILVGSRP